MKAWLKGGIFGIIIPFCIFIIFAISGMIAGPDISGTGEGFLRQTAGPILIFLWNVLDFLALPFCRGFCVGEEGMIKLFTTVPSFFIIGTIVGILIEKIKSK
jgi:hypothetical protein